MASSSSSSSSIPKPDFRILTFHHRDGTPAYPTSRPYQKRKPHTKSRLGCLPCKLRHVKCDQRRPSCDRCLRLASRCAYADDGAASAALTVSRPSPTLSPVDALLLSSSRQPPGTSRCALLHHFFSNHFFTSFKWPFPNNLEATTIPSGGSLLDLAKSQPFLLDVMLAVAASHIRHHSVVKQPSRLAEQYQQSLAIPGFRAALQGPRDDPNRAEAIVLTALFLNVLSFSAVDDDDPAKSWIFSRQPDRLAWLSLQLGFKPLVLSINILQNENAIGNVIHLHQVCPHTDPFNRVNSVLPLHWQQLFGSDAHQCRVLHDPARMAFHLSQVEPTCENFFFYCKFFSVMDTELRFRDLLECEDERAVWLFGYWLGLLNRFKLWWLRERVRGEWNAIRIWLDRREMRSRDSTWSKLMRDLDLAAEWSKPAEEGEDHDVSDMTTSIPGGILVCR
ncbi:hypothetical protein CP533_2525 [Ophiocordyceps camponoti-saundersi (nom. inval.)]|nr:hypothetical protein CP533_2525 [Ophiocordyceps camponoti-saundersi (nom. inval.)]